MLANGLHCDNELTCWTVLNPTCLCIFVFNLAFYTFTTVYNKVLRSTKRPHFSQMSYLSIKVLTFPKCPHFSQTCHGPHFTKTVSPIRNANVFAKTLKISPLFQAVNFKLALTKIVIQEFTHAVTCNSHTSYHFLLHI